MRKYDDIINLPHHVSKKHSQMSQEARAAQFAPFAALTGYDDAVKETARLTDDRIELDEEMKLCKQEYRDIDSFSDYRTNLRDLRFNLKQKINIEHIENESKSIDENNLINPMYNKIISEREIEDVTK